MKCFSTYKNEILKCSTSKAEGEEFDIADWKLASKYRVDVFTGNWSDWARKRTPPEEKKPEKQEKPAPERPREKKLKFSYNEQREFDTIDSVIAELDAQLSACRQEQESCGSDYVRLQALTAEQERLTAELDAKTERWVYLNDLKERIDAQ